MSPSKVSICLLLMFFFAVTVDEIEIKCERDDAGVLHCYKLYADSVTIFWAKANCASLGQHLVTISSKQEFEFVIDYLREGKAVVEVIQFYVISINDSN